MAYKTLFEILCTVLNKHYDISSGKVVDIDIICKDSLFEENGYIYKVKDSIIPYLRLLKSNKKGIEYVKYNKNTDVIILKRRINDFKAANYRK